MVVAKVTKVKKRRPFGNLRKGIVKFVIRIWINRIDDGDDGDGDADDENS